MTQVVEIPASVVRAIAGLPPSAGDFRSRFPVEQPGAAGYLTEGLAAEGELAVEFGLRLGAGLWAIYERALGAALPAVASEAIVRLEPAAQALLDGLAARHGGFDAEWLVELPRQPQPHVMGFLVGALRAARLGLEAPAIARAAVVLLSLSGALEAASSRAREALPGGAGGGS